MKRLKVATVVGTRPELIRLSRLIPLLDQETDHTFIHTGQNNDPKLKDVFFRDFALREPDHYLAVDNSSPMAAMAQTLTGVESVLKGSSFDALVVLGDTNSAIAALVARRMGIPTYHLEAGNRSFDSNVPEEINRRMIDHISTFNLPYSEPARQNLINEGIHPRFICLSGSPVLEVANHYKEEIAGSKIVGSLGLKSGSYFVVSAHRQENVDSPERLRTLVNSVNRLSQEFDASVVFPVHPRTRGRLSTLNLALEPRVIQIDPLGYFDFVALQKAARFVLSDSGTISEESSILGFPAATIRDSMERPEALESGAISLTGLEFDAMARAITRWERRQSKVSTPSEYQIDNFSERVLNFIESTAPQAAFWTGFRG